MTRIHSLSRKKKLSLKLIIPVVILLLVFSVYPCIRGIILGFCRYKVGKTIRFNGFDNYVGIYDTGYLFKTFGNIAFFVPISVVITYVLSMVLALLLNSDIPLKPLWRIMLIIGWAIPPVAKISMFTSIFSSYNGFINYILTKMGIIHENIVWFSESYCRIPPIACFVWGCLPFLTLSLYSTLQQIPSDITEAATLDGASSLQHFRYITLPYLNQTTGVCLSLIMVWIMNDFTTQYMLQGPGVTTLTPVVEAYNQGFRYGNFGFGCAYGNLMIIFSGVIAYFYLKFTNANDKGVN